MLIVGDEESQYRGDDGEDAQSNETISWPPPNHVYKDGGNEEQLSVDANVMGMSEALEVERSHPALVYEYVCI